MRKAQSSVEFMVLIAFVLFFFLTFLYAINVSGSDRSYEKQSLVIQDVARTIQEEIAFAYSTSDGYQHTFVLPATIVSFDYQIDFIGSNVYIHTLNGKQALSVPVKNVTGTAHPGSNIVRKANGVVYLNQ